MLHSVRYRGCRCYIGQGLGELKRKRQAADLILSAVNARH